MFLKSTFPVESTDIYKIDKKNSIGISVFGYENKEKHPVCVSKKCYEEKHFDLYLTGEEGKQHYVLIKDINTCYVLIKDINTFMYNHTLHRGKKQYWRYCLQAFSKILVKAFSKKY